MYRLVPNADPGFVTQCCGSGSAISKISFVMKGQLKDNGGFSFRSICTSFLKERGGGKAPNTSS